MWHCKMTDRPRKIDRKNERQQTLRKIKRATMQPHKPTHIVAHLILPNSAKTQGSLDQCTADNLSETFKLAGIKTQALRMKTAIINAQ